MSTTRAYDNLRDSRKLAAHHMLVQMSARFRVCARHNARLDEGEGEGDGVRRWTAVAPSDLDTLVQMLQLSFEPSARSRAKAVLMAFMRKEDAAPRRRFACAGCPTCKLYKNARQGVVWVMQVHAPQCTHVAPTRSNTKTRFWICPVCRDAGTEGPTMVYHYDAHSWVGHLATEHSDEAWAVHALGREYTCECCLRIMDGSTLHTHSKQCKPGTQKRINTERPVLCEACRRGPVSRKKKYRFKDKSDLRRHQSLDACYERT